MRSSLSPALILLITATATSFATDEFELPPIEYSKSTPDNPITQLQSRIDRGEAELAYEERFGYLPSLLKALKIRPDSQTLVFSKTSMQRHLIAPHNPRALYFNDDVYLGYCHESRILEISVADPLLGAVFYTLDQESTTKLHFERQTDNCLLCHGTGQTDYIPGHRIRSLFVDRTGTPILSQGSRRVDYTTPLEQRWGGWYVSGTHGSQSHLGNLIVSDPTRDPPYDNAGGHNIVDLRGRFSARDYLTGHSDIVALMVLEHQVEMHNLLTKASFTARQALYYEVEFNRSLGELAGNRLESTTRRIKIAGDRLLEGLLYANEAPIRAPILGSTEFAANFSQTGPRDRRGRSLRDFDLTTRMFKFPCSYLIYSKSFDRLPAEMRGYVVARLHDILVGKDQDSAFAHLSRDDRRAILDILEETKPGLWADQEK